VLVGVDRRLDPACKVVNRGRPLAVGVDDGDFAVDRVKPLRLPARSPNLNAFAERFVRSIKEECLDRMIFFGETTLRHALGEFVVHYHVERNQ
jgi:transposase InsO family protein